MNFISLNCTFRELILSCNIEVVVLKAVSKYCELYEDYELKRDAEYLSKSIESYYSALLELIQFPDLDKEVMPFYIDVSKYTGDEFIEVLLYNNNYVEPQKDIKVHEYKDENHRVFSSMMSHWSEHCSREVMLSVESLKYLKSLEDVLVELIYEITFNGFSNDDNEEQISLLDERVAEVKDYELNPQNYEIVTEMIGDHPIQVFRKKGT